MEQAAFYQKEIDTQEYDFNRKQSEKEALKKIKINDIINFYNVSYFAILLV